MRILEFGAVYDHHVVFVAMNDLSQRTAYLAFARTGWTQEQECSQGTPRVTDAELGNHHRAHHGVDGTILSDDLPLELIPEFLRFEHPTLLFAP
jgi:hypothetical protein